MIVMQLNEISKSFGADLILSKIKLEVHHDDRIAIVGRNGAGKSTLLKIMAGQMTHDDGDIFKPKDVTIGYLAQHTGLDSKRTIKEEMLTVFESTIRLEKELREMEAKMADPDILENAEKYELLLSNYDEKQNYFQSIGGFQYEAEIEAVLHGLQFGSFDFETPIHELSGGQKTRLALGKLLLSKPNILVLDEPTNHLDIQTLSWLETYIKNYDGAVVIVSHDRYFLDETVKTVYDVAFQTATKYKGNYTTFLQKRAEQYELQMKRFEKQQEEIKQLEEFVQKNIARDSTSKRAQSRRKKLEKMERIESPDIDDKSTKFSFEIERRSGNDVLKVDDLTAKYAALDKPIFQNVSFRINRADRVAIVGPNGVGKSTLLKALLNRLTHVEGNIQVGTNVQFGYYDQEQSSLTGNKTVLQELWDDYPLKPEKEIRTILGNFLFSGDDVLKTIGMLSGGEKARILLAKLMLQRANVLIMDEPTNHLDLDSKEVLEAALAEYPGTILFVSHDRYFINRLATHVMEMTASGTRTFIGDYDYYIEKLEEEKEIEALQKAKHQEPTQNEKNKNQFYNDKQVKSEIRKIERSIQSIEEQIEEHEAIIEVEGQKMYDPELTANADELHKIQQTIHDSEAKVEQLMEEWEELQEQLGQYK
ncbi:multidrug ABC transporter ATP-binding protein [Halalkalibacillus sediminis]|uniref:Multidrug ABC transporter ATP-binding protein n=1 Tax=Halalkalibacillus sediminis TaxID=2018042 RepID=A0A2I0QQD4_9BACI|nr:ABC-F family ATP-binding cassette domain-containing protein [Halalkalibacillus sediminis]PKR76529.1 multidrug ABC transporter ATP-binding protein [Halalkalibacillus sediminis]